MLVERNTSLQDGNRLVSTEIWHIYYLFVVTLFIVLWSYFSGYWRVLADDNLTVTLLSVTAVVFFISGTVKGVSGIGLGLVSVPIMTVLFDPALAVCGIAVPLVVTNFWQGIIRADAASSLMRYRTLFATMTIVMIGTAYFARFFSVTVTSFLLGTMAVIFSLVNLGLRLPGGLCWKFGSKHFTATVVRARRESIDMAEPTSSCSNSAMAAVVKQNVTEDSNQPARFADNYDISLQFVFGAMAGFVGGITGLVVIPLVLFMICRGVSKDEFVSSLGLLFLISGLVLILCYSLNGTMTIELFFLSTLVSIPALLGVFFGEKVRRCLNDQLFRKITLYLIFFIGVKILADVS